MPCCRTRRLELDDSNGSNGSFKEDVSFDLCPRCQKNQPKKLCLQLADWQNSFGRQITMWDRRNLTCCILGVVFVAIGLLQCLLIVSFGGTVLLSVVKNGVILGPDSPAMPFWKDIPIPLTTKVYLFNMTNPKEFAEGKAIPEVNQVGPFIYDEYHTKVKISWNEENNTVTYQQIRDFYQSRLQDDADFDKNVTIINAVAATLSAMVSSMNSFERGLVNIGIVAMKENLHVTSSPRKIIFDGYRDPLLDAAETLANLGIHFPGEMDKFAIFYGRNGSDWYDGVFNMYTGKDDLSKANKLAAWNYTDHTPFFPDRCGEVRGNAEMFTPFLTNDTVELYSNDLCRPMTMHFTENVHVKGVDGRRYEILPSYFANKTVNPENYCYEGRQEWPSGVYNASSCRFNAPVFISQPHFYQADPFYADQFKKGSFNPSHEEHATHFTINSLSGIPLEVVARFQVNLYIEKISEMKLFKKLKKPIFFPAFWFETKMTLGWGVAAQLWFLSNLVNVVLVIGLVITGCGLTCTVTSCVRVKKRELSSPQESSESEGDEGQEDEDVANVSSEAPLVNPNIPE